MQTNDPGLTQTIRKAAAQQALEQKAVEADQHITMVIGIENAGALMACPICGGKRWRTVLRRITYACRICGYEREAEQAGSPDMPG